MVGMCRRRLERGKKKEQHGRVRVAVRPLSNTTAPERWSILLHMGILTRIQHYFLFSPTLFYFLLYLFISSIFYETTSFHFRLFFPFLGDGIDRSSLEILRLGLKSFSSFYSSANKFPCQICGLPTNKLLMKTKTMNRT